MRQVMLGASGVQCGTIGLGCMGMSEFYGEADEAESLKTLERAFELGVTLYDTADMYGRGANERLVGRFTKGKRDDLVIETKFGVVRDPDGPSGSLYDRELDNSRDYMRACVEASLKRLGTDWIDIYYVHRMDPSRPVEDTMGDLAELVAEGKIRGIGLSEVSPEILRRAHAVHPVSALQSEYSLFHRDVETVVLPTCRELGIAFVPYSPLGRGFLAGAINSTASLPKGDLRRNAPRFQREHIDRNLALLERVKAIAAAKGCTLGQVALAWIFAQGDDMVPIPGTKRIKYLEENVGALDVHLTREEVTDISDILCPEEISGSREWVPPDG